MAIDVLVAYATKHGTTEEVAEAITEELKGLGLEVELRRLRKVRGLDGYRAVVIGAPLYAGRWQKDARKFLKRHGKALEELPVAVFALGPVKHRRKTSPARDASSTERSRSRPSSGRRRSRSSAGRSIPQAALPVQPHGGGRRPRLGRDPRVGAGLSRAS